MPNVTTKIDQKLTKKLDLVVRECGYISRADAVRAAIRELVEKELKKIKGNKNETTNER